MFKISALNGLSAVTVKSTEPRIVEYVVAGETEYSRALIKASNAMATHTAAANAAADAVRQHSTNAEGMIIIANTLSQKGDAAGVKAALDKKAQLDAAKAKAEVQMIGQRAASEASMKVFEHMKRAREALKAGDKRSASEAMDVAEKYARQQTIIPVNAQTKSMVNGLMDMFGGKTVLGCVGCSPLAGYGYTTGSPVSALGGLGFLGFGDNPDNLVATDDVAETPELLSTADATLKQAGQKALSDSAASAASGFASFLASGLKDLVINATCHLDPSTDWCDKGKAGAYARDSYIRKWGVEPNAAAAAALILPVGHNSFPYTKATVDVRVSQNPPSKFGILTPADVEKQRQVKLAQTIVATIPHLQTAKACDALAAQTKALHFEFNLEMQLLKQIDAKKKQLGVGGLIDFDAIGGGSGILMISAVVGIAALMYLNLKK